MKLGDVPPPATDNKDLVRFGAESPSRNSESTVGQGVRAHTLGNVFCIKSFSRGGRQAGGCSVTAQSSVTGVYLYIFNLYVYNIT